TQCGFVKLIPISHLDDFTVHHLPNKYVNKFGISGTELHDQINVLMQIGTNEFETNSLIQAESKLWRGLYSKDFYEPVNKNVISAIPEYVQNVLSVGCSSGATESLLRKRGLRVVAIPLDQIISSGAARKGVEMTPADLRAARSRLQDKQFDCLLFLNVLH